MPTSPRPSLWLIANQGAELAGIVVALGLLGWWIDKWLGSSHWFLILLILAAIVTEAYRFWNLSKQFLAFEEQNDTPPP